MSENHKDSWIARFMGDLAEWFDFLLKVTVIALSMIFVGKILYAMLWGQPPVFLG